jgi:hypothetical protein
MSTRQASKELKVAGRPVHSGSDPPPSKLHLSQTASNLDREANVGERSLKIVTGVVAPTTLTTALMYYFGRIHATNFFYYFGVDYNMIGLSSADYFYRSVDGALIPLLAGSILALGFPWVDSLVQDGSRFTKTFGLPQITLPICGVLLGLITLTFAAFNLLNIVTVPDFPEARGLCLCLGAITLPWGVRHLAPLINTRHRDPESDLLRPDSVPTVRAIRIEEWITVFLIVSVGLFWSVGSYAAGVGRTRGVQAANQLASSADVVLYSEKDLGLNPTSGLISTPCTAPNHRYAVRYDGLRLLTANSNLYILLPSGWTPKKGTSIVLNKSDSTRIEFSLGGASIPAQC